MSAGERVAAARVATRSAAPAVHVDPARSAQRPGSVPSALSGASDVPRHGIDLCRVPVQAKLSVGTSNDPLEQEADRVAQRVVSGRGFEAPKPAAPARESAGAQVDPALEARLTSPGAGRALLPQTRSRMEASFGCDFSGVRVHDSAAVRGDAARLGARAFTLGSHVFLGQGASERDTRLMAHELTHVVQQTGHVQRQATASPATARADEDSAEATCPEHLGDRALEIAQSRTSPGASTGVDDPLALSLYNFAIDGADPKPEHTQLLQDLASLLGEHARGALRVHLVGHTDCTGSSAHNTGLSQRRARAVRDVLQPLLTSRVGITWASEQHPVVSNATAEGRSRNRRVDIRFFVIGSPQPPGPQPPGPQPPGPGRGDDDERGMCERHPILCAGVGVPWLLPLLCLLDPALCLPPVVPPGLPPTPEPPRRPQRPGLPRVFFVPDVRASNSPSGMRDRISNASAVTITAVVLDPPSSGAILIDAHAGPRGGSVTLDGSNSLSITGTTSFAVQGSTLSEPGEPIRLQLGAWFGGDLVGSSNPFSVSAIMQDWRTSKEDAADFPQGFDLFVKMHWSSDGTSIRDLSQCHYVERVAVAEERGGMVGMGTGSVQDPDDFGLAEIMPGGDTHGTERRWLRTPGFQRLHQLWEMRDLRSGSDWVPSRASGFHIERTYERDPANPRCFRLVVRKRGAAAHVDGRSAAAGSGNAEHTWQALNCDPAPPTHDEPPVTPPTPEPQHEPVDPAPEPAPDFRPCDRTELARRVDACIEQARQDIILCHLALLALAGGPEGVLASLEYLACLADARDRLLECDRAAKRDTHCEESRLAELDLDAFFDPERLA